MSGLTNAAGDCLTGVYSIWRLELGPDAYYHTALLPRLIHTKGRVLCIYANSSFLLAIRIQITLATFDGNLSAVTHAPSAHTEGADRIRLKNATKLKDDVSDATWLSLPKKEVSLGVHITGLTRHRWRRAPSRSLRHMG